MTVTVNLLPAASGISLVTPANQVVHSTGLETEVEYGVLRVYSGPAQPVAVYAAGSWLSAVIS